MESVSLLSQQFTSRWHCPNVRTQHSSNNNIFWHYVYIASIVMEEGWCECLRFRHLAWEEMSWPDIHLQNMQLPSWLYISLHQDLSLWSFHIIIHSTLSVEHLLLLLDIGPAQDIIIHCGSIQMWPIINLNCGQFVIQLISPLGSAVSEGISLVMIAAPITSFPWMPLPLSCHNVPTHRNPDSGG